MVNLEIFTVPAIARRDCVNVETRVGVPLKIYGDLTKGIEVPRGCRVMGIELRSIADGQG